MYSKNTENNGDVSKAISQHDYCPDTSPSSLGVP